jgi:hypothetical protein
MSGTRSIISKGRIVRAADANLETPTQDLLNKLVAESSMSKRALEEGVIKVGDKPHVDNHWVGTVWWSQPNKQEIMKEAYIKALQLSIQKGGVPVVSYWVSIPDAPGTDGGPPTPSPYFECMVAATDAQISLFIVTPWHKNSSFPPAANAQTEDLWIIAPTERVTKLRDEFPVNYPRPPVEDTNHPGIKSWQIVGY